MRAWPWVILASGWACGGCVSPAPHAPPPCPPARYLPAPELELAPLPPDPDPYLVARSRVRVIDAAWPPASFVDPVTLLDQDGVLRVRQPVYCWPSRRWDSRACATGAWRGGGGSGSCEPRRGRGQGRWRRGY